MLTYFTNDSSSFDFALMGGSEVAFFPAVKYQAVMAVVPRVAIESYIVLDLLIDVDTGTRVEHTIWEPIFWPKIV
jgi:hypothetical protein